MRPFQALGRVQRGQRHRVAVVATLGQADDDADGLRHLQHALALAFEGAAVLRDLAAAAPRHPVDEVEHVAPARGGQLLAVAAVVQVLLVADVLEPAQQQGLGVLGAGGVARAVLQVVDVAAELMQRAQRLGAQHAGQRGREQRLEQADLPLAGKVAQAGQRLRADAALRADHRAQEGRVVVLVHQQAQPGAQVLDLGAVEEALSARHLVGDLRGAQLLLEHARLVVGAVEDGEVAELDLAALAAQRLDARHRAFGLVLLAVAFEHAHRLAVAQRAPQLLLEQLRVAGDHVVGRAQDVAGGAVVLLQRDQLQPGKVLRQPPQVVDGGAAPAVDALVVVAHRGEQAVAAFVRVFDQRLQQLVLHRVGVLDFVDQHVVELLLPLGCAPRRRAAAASAAGRSGRRSPPPERPTAAARRPASRARPRARRRWRPRRRRRPHRAPGSSTG